jgi:CelD/BcsL family acetyltransferase involved in cellulose biosynthesis
MSSAIAAKTKLTTIISDSFDDPAISPPVWDSLVTGGDTAEVFLTYSWQRTWWEAFGRGHLMLITVTDGDRPIAIAPLFADGGMVFFVGSGGSDYLDFIGDIDEPAVLDAILSTAGDLAPDFVGFRFYHVPDRSNTARLLSAAAHRLNLQCFDEGDLSTSLLDLSQIAGSTSPAERKSLVRNEKALRRKGELAIEHYRDANTIHSHLDEFFDQHIERWKTTPYPSLFLDPKQCEFYRGLTDRGSADGWLRFTRVTLNGRSIAFHFGSCYRGKYLCYKPAFAIDLARSSPGTVMWRHLLLAAIEEQARVLDFGLGDEAFKSNFAVKKEYVRTWGLYPRTVL